MSIPFDVARIRQQFPILSQSVHNQPIAFLDSAASSQKPQAVLDAMNECYQHYYANIHRGVYQFSEKSSQAFEAVRDQVARFIGAADRAEIIFTRGTTEAINLVAQTFGRQRVKAGDEILITALEHHANIVPWQMLCEERGASLRVIPINAQGELVLDELDQFFTPRTRLFAMTHTSNAIGTINPVEQLIAAAHAQNIPVLLDVAQGIPHTRLNVMQLDADFVVFSGHKLYGPSGAGVLYGKRAWLETLPPWQGGGDMIERVTFEKTTYAPIPHRFEAGTPDIVAVIGLGAAIQWLEQWDFTAITAHENALLQYATEQLRQLPGIRIIGEAQHKAAIISLAVEGVHPHDIGTWLDHAGIAVRTGHHCAQPLMQFFAVPATTRASFALYNTTAEIDRLVASLQQAQQMFR